MPIEQFFTNYCIIHKNKDHILSCYATAVDPKELVISYDVMKHLPDLLGFVCTVSHCPICGYSSPLKKRPKFLDLTNNKLKLKKKKK